MKYGRKDIKDKKRALTGWPAAAKKKILALSALLVMGACLAGAACVCYAGYEYVMGVIDEAPEISTLDVTPSGYLSTVLDTDENVIATLVSSGSNRVYATLDEIPEDLQHAFVAIEDERFYTHNGIDVKGIVRAAMVGVTTGSFSEGASTITQQLLKNNVFEDWTEETGIEKVERKIQEQYLALQLEKEVSKDWIMENYLNTINLGQNTLGVQSAASRYFGKDVSELTLSECAVLAAITQNPSKYNPISYPENNNERRIQVLDNMLDQGYITQEEYEEAVEDDVYSRILAVNTEVESTTNVTSYFVDALTEQVLEDLQEELGYSETEAYNALYSGGLTIYSTQDSDIQAILDEEVNDSDNYSTITTEISFSYALTIQQTDGTVENFSEQTLLAWYKESSDTYDINYKDEESAQAAIDEYREYLLLDGGTVLGENVTFTQQPQVSMTVIDQSTGEVKALIGGRGEKTASLTLNRATDSLRQAGSTFKILTAYSVGLETGAITLATEVLDEEIEYSSGQTVHNSDGKYRGYISIREAIENSVNVVAIKTIWEVTPLAGYEMALNYGISTLTEDDIVESLPLGVGTVLNIEMAAAYAAIANGGTYIEPILYTKVLDQDGNVLLEKTQETHEVIDETTAYLLTSAMEDVVASGTGTLTDFGGMSIAGKTGTSGSTDVTGDSWFVGFTPYYTCAIWGGFDDNSDLSSTKFTKIIWNKVMGRIHEGLEDTGFDVPDGIVQKTVCSVSGLIPVEGVCTSTKTEYFSADNVPEETCDSHTTVTICSETGLLATEYCTETETLTYTTSDEDAAADVPTEYCEVHSAEAAEAEEAAAEASESLQGEIENDSGGESNDDSD